MGSGTIALKEFDVDVVGSISSCGNGLFSGNLSFCYFYSALGLHICDHKTLAGNQPSFLILCVS